MTVIKNWLNVMQDTQSEEDVAHFLRQEIQELLDELNCRWGTPWDKVKEMADVIWCATALMERMGYDSDKVMERLKENNMSKAFATREEAETQKIEGCEVVEAGGLFVIMNSYNKIQKPKNFVKMGKDIIEGCRYDAK